MNFPSRCGAFTRVGRVLAIFALFLGVLFCGYAKDRKAEAEVIVPNLSDPDVKVRRKAVVAMVDIDQIGFVPESALEPLLKMATENDKNVRSWTFSALGMPGPAHYDRIGPILLAALKEGPDLAVPAAMALGQFKNAESVPPLVSLTEGPDSLAAHYAAEALSFIGTAEAKAAFLKYVSGAIPGWVKTFEGTDEIAKGDAYLSLRRMEAGMTRLGALESPEGKSVDAAMRKWRAKL